VKFYVMEVNLWSKTESCEIKLLRSEFIIPAYHSGSIKLFYVFDEYIPSNYVP
jgi:hypothetical protein